MAISLTDAAARILADAADIATGMGSGTTEDEVIGIATLLSVMAGRNDMSTPLLKLANTSEVTPG